MEINPDAVPWQTLYKMMTSAVIPRPIAWVSTIDAQGIPNLAPFSFFNAVCGNPPHLMFSSGVRGRDGTHKDTLINIRANGEFVVNIVTEALADAMNITSAELPPDRNEFIEAGLTAVRSHIVKPPRVAESPVHFECKMTQIVDVSTEPGGASVVFGRVVYMYVDDSVVSGERIDTLKLAPIGRLGGADYTRVNDLFDLTRPAASTR